MYIKLFTLGDATVSTTHRYRFVLMFRNICITSHGQFALHFNLL